MLTPRCCAVLSRGTAHLAACALADADRAKSASAVTQQSESSTHSRTVLNGQDVAEPADSAGERRDMSQYAAGRRSGLPSDAHGGSGNGVGDMSGQLGRRRQAIMHASAGQVARTKATTHGRPPPLTRGMLPGPGASIAAHRQAQRELRKRVCPVLLCFVFQQVLLCQHIRCGHRLRTCMDLVPSQRG